MLEMEWKVVAQRFGVSQVMNILCLLMKFFQNDCLERVKTLQLLSFDKSLDDIPYNFLIGDDGNTYEGRGYEFQGEVAEDETFNNLGLIIAFIGDFTTYLPIDSQIATLEKFLDDLDKREALTTGYKILYEDQMTNSEHFSSQVFDIFVKMEKFYNCSCKKLFCGKLLKHYNFSIKSLYKESMGSCESKK